MKKKNTLTNADLYCRFANEEEEEKKTQQQREREERLIEND